MEVSWPSAEQVKSEPEKSEHHRDELIRFRPNSSNHALILVSLKPTQLIYHFESGICLLTACVCAEVCGLGSTQKAFMRVKLQ